VSLLLESADVPEGHILDFCVEGKKPAWSRQQEKTRFTLLCSLLLLDPEYECEILLPNDVFLTADHIILRPGR
jgi:hypothetical protein